MMPIYHGNYRQHMENQSIGIKIQMSENKTKQLRIDADLFHILKSVSVDDNKWSKTARKYLWQYCKAVHPSAVAEIKKSYELGKQIAKENPIAAEVIRND